MIRLALAVLVPWLAFFTMGRPWAALACLLLQLSALGWLPAALWAVHAHGAHQAQGRGAQQSR